MNLQIVDIFLCLFLISLSIFSSAQSVVADSNLLVLDHEPTSLDVLEYLEVYIDPSEKLLSEWIFSFSSLNFFLAVTFGWSPYNFITSDYSLVEKRRTPKRNLPKSAIKIFLFLNIWFHLMF